MPKRCLNVLVFYLLLSGDVAWLTRFSLSVREGKRRDCVLSVSVNSSTFAIVGTITGSLVPS